MPRTSNLRLTEPQEAALSSYLDQRLGSLDADNRPRLEADRRSRLRYENDRRDRAIPDSIYEQSNVPLPITSMVTDYFLSRSYDEIFGEKPFFSARPQGASDREIARAIERLARYKLCDQGRLEEDLDDSLTSAHIHRACILKAVHREEIDTYERHDLNALHDISDPAHPVPIQILGGGYVLEDAQWIQQPDPAAPPPAPVLDPASGAMMPGQPAMRTHLAADPSFILDPNIHTMLPLPVPVPFQRILFAGPKSEEIESENFRAPSDARTIEEADFVAEYSDRTSDWLLDRFLERPWFTADLYRTMLQSADAQKKTAQKNETTRTQGDELEAENVGFDVRTHRSAVAEVWLTWNAQERDKPQRMVVWWDRDLKRCVFYDYQAMVSPTGRHPYRAIAIAKNKKRWWGYSLPELVEVFQEFVDLQFNRHAFRNSINANPIIGQNPDKIVERKSFSQLRPFETVTLEGNATMQEYLQAFVFPNADLDTETLVDKCIYFIQLWLGISNVAQGDYSDVPQNTTAFGQDATLREAAKVSRRFTRRVQAGVKAHIGDLVQVMVATMDEQEAYYFNEGDQSLMGIIGSDQVRSLPIDVQMVVGRAQNAQAIQATTLATGLVEKYATMLVQAPWMAGIVRPLYKISLRLLGFDDVDQLLPDPMNPGAAVQAAQMAAMLKGQTPDSAKDKPAPAEAGGGEETAGTLPFPGDATNAAASIITPPTPPDMNKPEVASA